MFFFFFFFFGLFVFVFVFVGEVYYSQLLLSTATTTHVRFLQTFCNSSQCDRYHMKTSLILNMSVSRRHTRSYRVRDSVRVQSCNENAGTCCENRSISVSYRVSLNCLVKHQGKKARYQRSTNPSAESNKSHTQTHTHPKKKKKKKKKKSIKYYTRKYKWYFFI